MKKVLLIDGNSMMSHAYYGNLPQQIKDAKRKKEDESKYYHLILQNSKGKYSNGLLGMTKQVLELLHHYDFTHAAITWDVTRDTFRRSFYPDYKSNREETPVPLKFQIITEQSALNYCGLKTFCSNPDDPKEKCFEGDDYIGSLVNLLEKENDIEICVYTKDQDYLQLASEKTTIWRVFDDDLKIAELKSRYRDEVNLSHLPPKIFPFTPYVVQNEYGLTPLQIIDMKALEGDTSDNIPGVHSVGEKTARPLLQHYGSIEKLYEEIEYKSENDLKAFWKEELYIKRPPYKALTAPAKDPSSSTLKDTLSAKESAFLSKKLATIYKECINEPVSLKDLEIHIDTSKLLKFLNKYELNSIRENLDFYTTKKEVQKASQNTPEPPKFQSICDKFPYLEQVKIF